MPPAPGPDTGANAETLPRRSRAERRREGLLPAGEDPVLRRLQAGPARPATASPPGGNRRRTDRPADDPVAPGPLAPSPRLHDSGPQPAVRAGRASRTAPAAAGPSRWDRPAAAAPSTPAWAPPGPPTQAADGWGVTPSTAFAPVAGPPSAPLTSLAPVAGPPSAPPTSLAPVSGPPTAFDQVSAPALSPRTGERPTPGPGGRPGAGPRSGPLPGQPAARVAAPRSPAALPDDAPPLVPGPASGPVGGRAAARLERQAAEAAARKAGRRGSTAAGAPPAPPRRAPDPVRDTEPAGAPRKAVQFLLAMVVVALVLLGVWTFTIPRTEVASSGLPADTAEQVTTPPAPAEAPVEAVPPTDAAQGAAAVPEPVRAPVTVLNSTSITGLAASVAGQIAAGGWTTLAPGTIDADDVAITTVYYTEGDAGQQAAAEQLVGQFPDISGPAPRFFEVPGVAEPGLVVVATGNWQP